MEMALTIVVTQVMLVGYGYISLAIILLIGIYAMAGRH